MIDPDAFDWETSDRRPLRSAVITLAIAALVGLVGWLLTH